jgi:colicin import membrane protein
MKQIISVLASTMLFAACSHFKSNEEVSKEQIARVPPQNMASVNQARVKLAQAEDEVARQQLGVKSAKDEVNVANDEVNVAQAEIDRLNSTLKKAETDRKSATIRQTKQQLRVANAKLDAAKARLESAKAGVDLANAKLAEAEAERDLAKDQLEYQQYLALKQSGDPEWKKVNANGILSRIDEDKKKIDSAKQQIAHQQTEAAQRRAAWQAALQNYQRLSGVGGSGK